MNKQELREFQMEQLNLIKEVDKVSKEIGIDYYLIGGTLLGAVRHGGFIPWDEDMDIAMKRDDYERFREYWTNRHDDTYFYQHYTTEKNHTSPHAILKNKKNHIYMAGWENDKNKPMYDGLYLDIFPLDEPPKNELLQNLQARSIRVINTISRLKVARVYGVTNRFRLLLKPIAYFLTKPISFKTLYGLQDRIMQKYNGRGNSYLVSMASHYSYKKQLMENSIYGMPKKMYFEGIECSIPAETDKYLKQLYGDYMKIPQSEKLYNHIERITFVKD